MESKRNEMNTTGYNVFDKPDIPKREDLKSKIFSKGNFLLQSIDAVAPARGTESPFATLNSPGRKRKRR